MKLTGVGNRVSAVAPMAICTRDAVKVAFSFIDIPIKNKQYKLIASLRAVVLFNEDL